MILNFSYAYWSFINLLLKSFCSDLLPYMGLSSYEFVTASLYCVEFKSFVRYMHCKYSSQTVAAFLFTNGVFQKIEVFNVDEVHFVNFFLYG